MNQGRYSRQMVAEVFVRQYSAAKTKKRQDELVLSLAALILEQKMQSEIDLIAREIIEAQTRLTGTLAAEVHYNFEPGDKVLGNITDRLKALTGAKKVIFDEQHQPDLLGGISVRTPKAELDLSLRRRLDDFKLRVTKTV